MISISTDLKMVSDAMTVINTTYATIKSNAHVNTIINSAYTIADSGFTEHMMAKAVSEPRRLSHMYEWNHVGDPHFKLWRTKLIGQGARRTMSFSFAASKTAVPVSPKLKSVGVQGNHIFVWKAMVFEYGLPVHISPKLAKALVFERTEAGSIHSQKRLGSWSVNGITYFKGNINIDRAGNEEMSGAFTEAYMEWWGSEKPGQIINESLLKKVTPVINKQIGVKLSSMREPKSKQIQIRPIGLDPGFEKTLEQALARDYTIAAATRRIAINDE